MHSRKRYATNQAECASVALLAVEYPQDGKEKVDDVKVEADCGGNLLFDVIMANDQSAIQVSTEYQVVPELNLLCVDENVAREYQGTDDTIAQLDP